MSEHNKGVILDVANQEYRQKGSLSDAERKRIRDRNTHITGSLGD